MKSGNIESAFPASSADEQFKIIQILISSLQEIRDKQYKLDNPIHPQYQNLQRITHALNKFLELEEKLQNAIFKEGASLNTIIKDLNITIQLLNNPSDLLATITQFQNRINTNESVKEKREKGGKTSLVVGSLLTAGLIGTLISGGTLAIATGLLGGSATATLGAGLGLLNDNTRGEIAECQKEILDAFIDLFLDQEYYQRYLQACFHKIQLQTQTFDQKQWKEDNTREAQDSLIQTVISSLAKINNEYPVINVTDIHSIIHDLSCVCQSLLAISAASIAAMEIKNIITKICLAHCKKILNTVDLSDNSNNGLNNSSLKDKATILTSFLLKVIKNNIRFDTIANTNTNASTTNSTSTTIDDNPNIGMLEVYLNLLDKYSDELCFAAAKNENKIKTKINNLQYDIANASENNKKLFGDLRDKIIYQPVLANGDYKNFALTGLQKILLDSTARDSSRFFNRSDTANRDFILNLGKNDIDSDNGEDNNKQVNPIINSLRGTCINLLKNSIKSNAAADVNKLIIQICDDYCHTLNNQKNFDGILKFNLTAIYQNILYDKDPTHKVTLEIKNKFNHFDIHLAYLEQYKVGLQMTNYATHKNFIDDILTALSDTTDIEDREKLHQMIKKIYPNNNLDVIGGFFSIGGIGSSSESDDNNKFLIELVDPTQTPIINSNQTQNEIELEDDIVLSYPEQSINNFGKFGSK